MGAQSLDSEIRAPIFVVDHRNVIRQWGTLARCTLSRRGRRTGFLVRQEFKMRRTLGVFLILLLWFGPLAPILTAPAESDVPACCRRHGAHHCMMAAARASMRVQAASGSRPILNVPSRCPLFPPFIAAGILTTLALSTVPVALPGSLRQAHSFSPGRAFACVSQIGTRAGRAPPASILPLKAF
jgi:hypothetical protein